MAQKKYDLQERLIQFAIDIINLVSALPSNRVINPLIDQIVRSGTCPALIYAEAQAAESSRDFVHKMKVGLKELRETRVNLRVLIGCGFVKPSEPTKHLLKEADELIAIFYTSIETARGRIRQSRRS